MSTQLQACHRLGRSVAVTAGEVELFTYTYGPDAPVLESPKPYLHPIRTMAGDVVTEFRPHDHVWHKGIAWSLPHVSEHNFWGGPTYVDGEYVQLENNGSAIHRELTALSVAGGRAEVAHRLDWSSQHGDPVIAEHRALTAVLLDEATWALIFATEMTNVSGTQLDFGSPTTKGRQNAGYGGLFWRGPRSFTGGVIQSPDGAGADELMGTRAEWFGFRGRHDGSGNYSTVVMLDDPANAERPVKWFARSADFACLCPSPFFDEEVPLAPGEVMRLRYAVVVAAGDRDDTGTATLADLGRSVLASGWPPAETAEVVA